VGEKSWGELKLVRYYGQERRAMHLDPQRGLLMLFPTDMAKQVLQDVRTFDVKSFSSEGVESAEANEVPDEFENTRAVRRNLDLRIPYQFVVYDINSEKQAGFPYRTQSDKNDSTVLTELRWLYFSLLNQDGTPDSDEEIKSLDYKFFRTNIWDAKPNLENNDSFFISHRGIVQANNIVEVAMTGDPRPTPAVNGACESMKRLVGGVCVPFTSSVFDFKRVYGFNGEIDGLHYVGDFSITPVQGQRVLVVNHFRDLVYWKNEDRRFSLAAKTLGEDLWRTELFSTSHKRSYYQIAMNQDGAALTCSYYSGSVILLKINPGEDIREIKEIR
jgi:hypothetical protein